MVTGFLSVFLLMTLCCTSLLGPVTLKCRAPAGRLKTHVHAHYEENAL